MVSFFVKHRKKTALLLLINFLISFIAPLKSWAITSGPSQPEMSGFQPIGSSDMVDLFSGDFKYNIPLMDVGGYPLNLSYNAGSGIEDEASWVGFGWSLNPGAVNRQMKALPDDFKGDMEPNTGDKVEKVVNLKKKVKVGLSVNFKPDIFGFEKLGKKIGANIKASIGYKASIYKDNYYGWSASLGINPSLDVTKEVSTKNTEGVIIGKKKTEGSIGLGINSSSRDGANFSQEYNFAKTWSKNEQSDHLGLSIGFDYNSRQGMQSQSLSLSYAHTGKKSDPIKKEGTENSKGKEVKGKNPGHFDGSASYIDNGVMTYTPTVDLPRKTDAFTLSFHLGGEFIPVKGVVGAEGSYSAELIPQALRSRSIPAYGFLYEHETNNDALSTALTDVNREKDIPYFEGVPVLPIPILTNDNFNITSQNGSGQFKIYRNGSGITHDPYLRTQGTSASVGFDVAGGNLFNVGGNVYINSAVSTTGKWVKGNLYHSLGKFKEPNAAQPLIQNTYFKKSGEMTESDNGRSYKLGKENPVKVELGGSEVALRSLSDNYIPYTPASLEDARREKRTSNFSYLTAAEAQYYGLEKTIPNYPLITSAPFTCAVLATASPLPRISHPSSGYSESTEGYMRKRHHISEIAVLDGNRTKMVYGIPVYNRVQEEVTFAVQKPTGEAATNARISGLIGYTATDNSWNNTNGRDNYYSKDVIPAYATSYLLTGILSADYRDRSGNGISDDDYGNAVKFNYSKLPGYYKWRTPYEGGVSGSEGRANYNHGMLGDDFDDKANYTYGEKEIWYMHSIESKNSVALFFLSDREDGLGVMDHNGGENVSFRLKKLDKIVLYAKEDFRLNGSNAKPIKTVHFEYNYSIGTNFPNHETIGSTSTGTGKLALKKIYFTYGKNTKGISNPYQFFYKTACKDATGTVIPSLNNPAYKSRQSDRWGTYKSTDYNPSMLPPSSVPASNDHFTNAEFPYTLQDPITNEFAGMWNLEQIMLPSGGEIKIDYESDDYAYVQNKRATAMFQVYGVGYNPTGAFPNTGTNFIDANTICIRSKTLYSNPSDLVRGMKYLYGKFYIQLVSDAYDYVPGYAEIESVSTEVNSTSIPGEYIYKIIIKKTEAEGLKNSEIVNPFAVGAWQYLRNNLPHRAYPGYDNNTAGDGNVGNNIIGAIKALGQAILNFGELFGNPNSKFRRLNRANLITPEKSWVRLIEPTGKRKGGGHRVKKVTLSDNWASMVGDTENYTNNSYGQIYEYNMLDEEGVEISSGVASYEPGMGSDENPFKVPVFYSKEVKWGLDYNTYVEEPIAESYMPAPNVGYRKVTVKSFGATGDASAAKLGYTVNEFYTSKDFPLIVEKTGPVALSHNPKFILSLLGSVVNNSISVSQGVSVVQNDMHGKPKADKVYDRNHNLLSSNEYTYQLKDPTAVVKQLDNEVDLLRKDGRVSKGLIGQDMEFYTDMRYQQTNSTGIRVGVYGGAGFLAIFPVGFLGINIGANISNSVFHSTSSIKLISKYGILKKVTKMVNGSQASTENLMWDPETGEVLLTKTNNEYDQPVYNLTYPVHWAYEMMGPAYQNNESVLTNISTQTTAPIGKLTGAADKLALLKEGDELIDITDLSSSLLKKKYWIVYKNDPSTPVSPPEKFLITSDGEIVEGLTNRTFKVHHSGYTNGSANAIASIVCLNNPIVNGAIAVNAYSRVIDAKAVIYSDQWTAPVLGTMRVTDSGCVYEDGGGEINPYYHNLRGQWRPSYSYVYHAKRNNEIPANSSANSNISKTGEYLSFNPFYTFSGGSLTAPFPGLSDINWVWSQRPTLFNTKGAEIENEDALNKFSAAVYGHNEQLAVAVAKNARALEIKFLGFEDEAVSSACCIPYVAGFELNRKFNAQINPSAPYPTSLDHEESHSGKHSLKIANGGEISLTTDLLTDYSVLNNMITRATNFTTYNLNNHYLNDGFKPLKEKAYILSFWIKDNDPTTRAPKLELTQDTDPTPIDLTTNAKWPIVEGWKRIEYKFTTGSGTHLNFRFKATANIHLDDIRVFPADAQMKTYAYDNISQRLMAELDENNFATFYEYDDEGTLIRVKKETDRGIKTIKESRQHIRKTN